VRRRITIIIMCSSLGLTRCISCLGMILSCLSLAPVVLIHVTNKNHKLMLPFLDTIKRTAEEEFSRQRITESCLQAVTYYVSYVSQHAIFVSLVVFVWNSVNLLMDFTLLIGSCCRVRCLVLPWLIVSIIQLLIIGCPLVICSSYIAIYFLLQGDYTSSLLTTFIPTLIILFLLLFWSTVLAAYIQMGQARVARYNRGRGRSSLQAEQHSQPLLSHHGYKHSQYTQFYQPRHKHTQPLGPTNLNLYPTLSQA